MEIEQSEPDFTTARTWLKDEGFCREDLVTLEQMRAAARQLEERAREMLSIAEDVTAELDRLAK